MCAHNHLPFLMHSVVSTNRFGDYVPFHSKHRIDVLPRLTYLGVDDFPNSLQPTVHMPVQGQPQAGFLSMIHMVESNQHEIIYFCTSGASRFSNPHLTVWPPI